MNRLFANFPSEIRALFFIKIFTTFSYAVLYSSLILYMNQNLKLSSVEATGVVGVFISLNFLLHFAGAYAGGKLVSNRTLLVAGMCLELVGCLILNSYLYVGLGIFLSGSGLYATSINAIMIQQYQPEDDRRELASFWLYSAMNLGFFIGGTVSGYFHMYDQYAMMFYLAALVSIGSIVLILTNWHTLQDKTTEYVSLSRAIQQVRNNYSLLAIPLIAIMVILALYYHEKTSALIISCGAVINDDKEANRVANFGFIAKEVNLPIRAFCSTEKALDYITQTHNELHPNNKLKAIKLKKQKKPKAKK
jgi:POT family proton-dependent oligopeptide transporter